MSTTYDTATVNRVAGYFQKPLPQIPEHGHDRQAIYTESILQAVLAMRALLDNTDKSIVLKAAQELFTLERTRLRHNRNISGCRDKLIPKWQSDRETVECFEDPGPQSPKQLENVAIAAHGKEARAELVEIERAKPEGESKHVHSTAGQALVIRCLKHWNVTACSILPGTFWEEYLRRTDSAGKSVPLPADKPPKVVPVSRKVDPTLVADWNVELDFGEPTA